MTTTRRDLLTAALTTAAGVAVTAGQVRAGEPDHDHDHQAVPSDPALRAKALESVLVAKGLVDRAALDALVDTYEHQIGPRNGARVIARAWVDAAYKQRLLTNANAAIAELGYGGEEGEQMVVVENTRSGPQPHRLHALFLLSLAGAGIAAGLVQVRRLSFPVGHRSARRVAGVRPGACRRRRGARLGQHRRSALSCASGAPSRNVKVSAKQQLAALVTRDAMVGVSRVAARHEQERGHERRA